MYFSNVSYQEFLHFIKSVLKNTLWDFLFILFLGLVRYLLQLTGIFEKIQKPFIVVFACSLVLGFISIGIMGAIENRVGSYESWASEKNNSLKKKTLVYFNAGAILIPTVLFYCLFIYFLRPTLDFWFLTIFLVGLLIKNIVKYFVQKDEDNDKEIVTGNVNIKIADKQK